MYCRHEEHERQVQQLQQQLQLAQQEHCNLQARLEASKQAAAARKAEAAAAATAEKAALAAAAEAKKQRQAAAAAAAVAGAQPRRSCPGFQPLQLPQQQPVQLHQQQMPQQQPVQQQQLQILQEIEGQHLLSQAATGRRNGSPVPFTSPATAQQFVGPSTSGMSFSPGSYQAMPAGYAACVQDMQQHIHTLKGSMARHKHQKRHRQGHGKKHVDRTDRLQTDRHAHKTLLPHQKDSRVALQGSFDSEADSDAESEAATVSTSGADSDGSGSDRYSCQY